MDKENNVDSRRISDSIESEDTEASAEIPYLLIQETVRSVCKITMENSHDKTGSQRFKCSGYGFLCMLQMDSVKRCGLMTSLEILGGHGKSHNARDSAKKSSFAISFFDNETEKHSSITVKISINKDVDYVFTDDKLGITFLQFKKRRCISLYQEDLVFLPLAGDVLPEIGRTVFITEGGGNLVRERVSNVEPQKLRFFHTLSTKGSHGSPIFAMKSKATQRFPVIVLGVASCADEQLNLAMLGSAITDSIRKDIHNEEYTNLCEAMKSRNFDQLKAVIAKSVEKNGADLIMKFTFDLNDIDEPVDIAHFAASVGSVDLLKYLTTREISGLKMCRTKSSHQTVLMTAALSGQVAAFRYFLTSWNSSLTDVDRNGDTVLHISSKYYQVEIVKEILSNISLQEGVKLLLNKNQAGQTSLHVAVENGSQAVVDYVLTAMPKDLKQELLLKQQDNKGYTPFLAAVRSGNRHTIDKLLMERVDSVKDRDFFGCHAIHLAAMYCSKEMVEFFIQICGKDILKAKDRDCQTVLFRAILGLCAENPTADNAEILLQYDEVRLQINDANIHEQTALHFAAVSGKVSLVKFLLEVGANLRKPDINGEVPIHYAAASGHDEVVSLMLDKDPGLLELPNSSGLTIIHKAAGKGKVAVLELLQKRNANFFARDNTGSTVAHTAVQAGHVDVISMLFDNGKTRKLFTAVDNTNSTPIFYAASVGAVASIRVLFENSASNHEIGLETRGQFSYTPLLAAVVNGQFEAFTLLDTRANRQIVAMKGLTIAHLAAKYSDKILNKLLEDADENMTKTLLLTPSCDSRFLPFHDAIIFKNLAAIKIMCKYADKWKLKNALLAHFKTTTQPLILAAKMGHWPIFNYLVDSQDFTITVEDRDRNTVLHESAKFGRLKFIKELFHSKKPNQAAEMLLGRNRRGEVPIYVAAVQGHLKVVQWIYKYSSSKLRRSSGIEVIDKFNMTILHAAARNGCSDVFEFIQQTNLVNVLTKDNEGKTALHYAAMNGHIKIMARILSTVSEDEAMLQSRDSPGATVFLRAVEFGHFDVVEMLLKIHPDSIKDKDYEGNGPAWYAQRCQSYCRRVAMAAVLEHYLA